MPVTETMEFWQMGRQFSDTTQPPEEWSRVVGCKTVLYEEEFNSWIASDTCSGEYCWHYHHHMSNSSNMDAVVWAFSDANTALAFKLRFG